MNKLPESLKDREQAVEMDATNPEAYLARGGSYHLLGEHEKGLADRTRAIGLSPGYAMAWAARGNAYFLLGRYDEALADLTQAEHLEPGNPETRRLRESAQQKVDEIIEQAKAKERAPETGKVTLPGAALPITPIPAAPETPPQAETQPPPQPAAPPPPPAPVSAAEYQARGRKLIQEEKYREALDPLTQAVKLDPFLSAGFNARGYAYFRMKQYPEAIADFDRAIRLNPTYTNAYVNRASARRAAGDTAGAESDQAKVRDLMKMTAK